MIFCGMITSITVKFNQHDGKKSDLSSNDFWGTISDVDKKHPSLRDGEFELNHNVSRENLTKAGVSSSNLEKHDKDNNGFNGAELLTYMSEVGSLDISKLEDVALVITRNEKPEDFSYLDSMIASFNAEPRGGKFYLKHIHDLFIKEVYDSPKDNPKAQKIDDFDDFKSTMSMFCEDMGTKELEDRIPDYEKKLKKAYEKLIEKGETRGVLTADEFAETIIDHLTLGENSYQQLKIDPDTKLPYIDAEQLAKMDSIINPPDKTFKDSTPAASVEEGAAAANETEKMGTVTNDPANIFFKTNADGNVNDISYKDMQATIKPLLIEHPEYRLAYPNLLNGNISREALIKAGVSDTDLKKYNSKNDGFNYGGLKSYLYDHKDKALDLKKLNINPEEFGFKENKKDEFLDFNLDDVTAAYPARGKKVYLKDIRDFFSHTVSEYVKDGYGTAISGRSGSKSIKFSSKDQFKAYMNNIAFAATYTFTPMADRISDWDAQLDKMYSKYIEHGKSRSVLTANEFAAITLDLTLGENSYGQLKKDPANKNLRYFDNAQIAKVNSIFNPKDKAFRV